MRPETIRSAIAHLQARIPLTQSTARRAYLMRQILRLQALLPEPEVLVPF